MADKKTKHEFIRQTIKEAIERIKPELHAASEVAHHLDEEAEADKNEASFERTVELGYVVDVLANLCGPNLAVLYEVACALGRRTKPRMSRSWSSLTKISHTGINSPKNEMGLRQPTIPRHASQSLAQLTKASPSF